MKVMGWAEAQIHQAAADMSKKVENEFELWDLSCIAQNSRRGGSTFQFILRPKNSARRLAGDRNQPIPFKDLGHSKDDIYPQCVVVKQNGERRKGVAAPCWHGFGHFFRALFNLNPNGKIVTGIATYDGEDGFNREAPYTDRNVGSMFSPQQYSDCCDCDEWGLEDF